MGEQLREMCAATAALRHRLLAEPQAAPQLRDRLARLVGELAAVPTDGLDRGSLLILLDEVTALSAALAAARASARDEVAALQRHRRAQRCYALAPRAQ